MALAPVILVLAFSFATLRAGGTFFVLAGARLLPVFLMAQSTFLHGCFPPSSGVAVDLEAPEVLGVTSSAETANLALGSLDGLSTRLGVCLVLAIYNTDFLFTNSSTCHPRPNTISHSIHTASSLFALSAWCNLGFSTSWTTIFHCFHISADTCAQCGILPSYPGSVQSPLEADIPWHSSLLLPFWKKFRYMQCQLVLMMSTRVPFILIQFSILTQVQMGIIFITLFYIFSIDVENDYIHGYPQEIMKPLIWHL